MRYGLYSDYLFRVGRVFTLNIFEHIELFLLKHTVTWCKRNMFFCSMFSFILELKKTAAVLYFNRKTNSARNGRLFISCSIMNKPPPDVFSAVLIKD